MQALETSPIVHQQVLSAPEVAADGEIDFMSFAMPGVPHDQPEPSDEGEEEIPGSLEAALARIMEMDTDDESTPMINEASRAQGQSDAHDLLDVEVAEHAEETTEVCAHVRWDILVDRLGYEVSPLGYRFNFVDKLSKKRCGFINLVGGSENSQKCRCEYHGPSCSVWLLPRRMPSGKFDLLTDLVSWLEEGKRHSEKDHKQLGYHLKKKWGMSPKSH